ncbi:GGDEF domain-containing protein [Pseudoalteromonas mariniglutinosa]|uniref:GGDEF domain-containing protein n=1 Tax=Pseudoalteromonas mariniglutinosa TaxID=206042 RepID=UPI00384BF36E
MKGPKALNAININHVYLADKQRRVFSLFTMSFIAVLLISALVVANFYIYAPILTVMLIVSDITIVTCLYYYFRTGMLVIITSIILVIIALLCIALVYTGGKDNTALYWLMFYPVVTFVCLGLRNGSLLVGLIYVSVLVLLYGPDISQVHYREVEKSRFFAAFTVLVLLSFISEFFRNKSHQQIADITLLEKQDALTDPLTGLANRRYIIDYVLPQCDKNPQVYLPMALLLIDLDNFKALNDSYGHDFGDQALLAFSDMLDEQLRISDIKARFGGEEFIVLLLKTDIEQASRVADKVRAYVANKAIPYNISQSVHISCSIGISDILHSSQFHKAVKQADRYLYKAKAAGRNQVMSSYHAAKKSARQT